MNLFGSSESNIFTGLLGGLFGLGGGGGSSWDAMAAKNGSIKWNADGGYISGPGTATSDSIPSMLSNGEYVIKASSVSKYGTAFFDALNYGVHRFADGGSVGNYVSPSDLYRQDGQSINVSVNQTFNGQQDTSVLEQIKASMPYIKAEISGAIRNETNMRAAVRGAAK